MQMNAETLTVNREEFVGLNIIEAIDTCELTGVKIGAKNGSSFFYIGEIANFRGRRGELLIEKIERDLETIMKKRYQDSLDTYNQMVRNYPTPTKYIQTKDKRGCEYSYEDYQNVLKDYFGKCAKRKEIKDGIKVELENRIPFEKRTVVDAYMSTIPNVSAIIFIVDGNEYGDYWTREEYERGEKDAEDEDKRYCCQYDSSDCFE